MYPLGPIFHGSGLNITVMSLTGMLDVGIMSCPELLPDLWDMADDFARGARRTPRRYPIVPPRVVTRPRLRRCRVMAAWSAMKLRTRFGALLAGDGGRRGGLQQGGRRGRTDQRSPRPGTPVQWRPARRRLG